MGQISNCSQPTSVKTKEAKSAHFSRLNPRTCKSFWQAIKYINKKESSIPTLKDDSSSMVAISSSDKANMLNSFFARCFNHALPPLSPESHPNIKIIDSELLHDLLCTEEEVCQYLSALDTTTAKLVVLMGYQQNCLRRQQSVLHLPLVSTSLMLGELPAEWKYALITSIPKSNKMAAVSNYQPISLLPLLSKVLERRVHSLLMKHLCETDPISSSQFGFLKGRSTTGALVSAVNDWHTHLDNNLNVCVVFFDLKKVFDSVPHTDLLNKLASLNLNPYLFRWIVNYLHQRTQAVGE